MPDKRRAPLPRKGPGMSPLHDMNRAQTPRTLPGVFLALRLGEASSGVLIMGEAGIGKSELALDLISRGHALIADDGPLFHLQDGRWLGRCPPPLQGFLEVRGLGILDIRRLFGERALCDAHPLDLIIRLLPSIPEPEDRLRGAWGDFAMGGQLIPELSLGVGGGRHLAVLAETAVRMQSCAMEGSHPPAWQELSARLAAHLDGRAG